jgi:excisionase family DNA binding protein
VSDSLQLVTPAELAALLRLSTRKIRAMKSAGQLPTAKKFGRSVRWRRSDLEKWMSAKAA